MNLNKAEIKELAMILTFDLVQGQATKLRDVGEHERADVLWNVSDKISNAHEDHENGSWDRDSWAEANGMEYHDSPSLQDDAYHGTMIDIQNHELGGS